MDWSGLDYKVGPSVGKQPTCLSDIVVQPPGCSTNYIVNDQSDFSHEIFLTSPNVLPWTFTPYQMVKCNMFWHYPYLCTTLGFRPFYAPYHSNQPTQDLAVKPINFYDPIKTRLTDSLWTDQINTVGSSLKSAHVSVKSRHASCRISDHIAFWHSA
jgi:hypothetical protein